MFLSTQSRDLSASEMVIHRLYEITSDYDAGFDQQIRDLLQLGLDRFQLDIGIVSRIENGTYTVRSALAPDGVELSRGDQFELGTTYCSIAVEADGPVGFEHAGNSTFARHPAYGMFKLESYIGVPLYVGDAFFGTLNFSSPRVRERKFKDTDVDCLRLMATWLGTELHRRRIEDELSTARHHLEQLVRTDPLTELLNRRGVRESLQGHARRSGHDGTPLSAVLIDIDDFKSVNDTYGHSAGDAVIRAVAESVRGSLRPADVAGRIGGDEFVAILPGAELHEAKIIAERIADAVRTLDLSVYDLTAEITVSIGVATVSAEVASVTDLLARTETLLRRSKKDGKNTVTVEAQTA